MGDLFAKHLPRSVPLLKPHQSIDGLVRRDGGEGERGEREGMGVREKKKRKREGGRRN